MSRAKDGNCSRWHILFADGVEAELTEEEAELLAAFNSIGSAALKKVALEQMRLLVGVKEN